MHTTQRRQLLQRFADKHLIPRGIYCVIVFQTEEQAIEKGEACGMWADYRKYIIIVSESLFNVVSIKEILSMLAHEMGHLYHYHFFKNEYINTEILRGQDAVDFNWNMEYKADEFSLLLGGSKRALLRSLRKVYPHSEETSSNSHPAIWRRENNLI